MDPHFSEFSDLINVFKFDDTPSLPSLDQSQNLTNGFKLPSDSVNGIKYYDTPILPSFDQSLNFSDGFKFQDGSLNLNFLDIPSLPTSPDIGSFAPLSNVSSEVDSTDDHDSDPVLKYLNQILMEENMEEKPSMFYDPLALRATEKSLYEVLGEKYPPLPYQLPSMYNDQNVYSPDNFLGSSSEYSSNSGSSGGTSIDTRWIVDPGEHKLSMRQSNRLEYSLQPGIQTSSQWSFGSMNSFGNNVNNSQVDSSASAHLVPNIFSHRESILQFKRGMEEAKKFLPTGNQLIIDLDKYNLPLESKEAALEAVVKVEKDERDYYPNGWRGRKHHELEEDDLEEERSSKQSAVYVEEAELAEMFDKVLLFCNDAKGEPACSDADVELPNRMDKTLQQNGQPQGSNSGKAHAKKQGNKSEAVDLRTLLISCAQSVAADDRRTANEQLKQIRKNSSPSGDAYQRLANIFANGLEARMAGTGTQLYAALASKRISATEKLKAYQLYLSACPFKKISIGFANLMILEAASEASTLHIVDFGISYGFQWPVLIQLLASRLGGPPKLRITGIELPQPGFRPAELVEETGRRLAKYCERFNVSFEYHAIATQKWETIQVEDLKIQSGEVLAVNCLFLFSNLLDETVVVVDNSRDAVLKLIRQMNPDIYLQAVISGSYSAPFFVTRFREALYHYSALFDMFDTTIPRDNQLRSHFEQEFYGREAMNVIACEGLDRVERPETYKQWQGRIMRAGFKPLPLNQEILKKLRGKVKAGYHKDFVFDEDGQWMLQGWKGRIIYASSCWVPA